VSALYQQHADLYDIAFDWDVSDEATWLEERLGPDCREVLEPGCGSGRMLEALARRGLRVTGIDDSARMLELARARIEGLPAQVVAADMTDFDLGRVFDGAVCPINTLRHLSREGTNAHLRAMAAALRPGARYLVQLGIVPAGEAAPSHWEADRDGMHLVVDWVPESRDRESGVELHRSTISVTAGSRAGETYEEVHAMTVWDHDDWRVAVEAAGLEWFATYDGAEAGRPRLGFDATGGLLWHELRRP
jgi:SAM-dependent methyltransferase